MAGGATYMSLFKFKDAEQNKTCVVSADEKVSFRRMIKVQCLRKRQPINKVFDLRTLRRNLYSFMPQLTSEKIICIACQAKL